MLQSFTDIAYKMSDLISTFEDDLANMWNKSKRVTLSGYVITLDRVYEKSPALLESITRHPGFTEQIKEWQRIGIVDESFTVQILFTGDLTGACLNPQYRFLPLDTRYFKDLEEHILSHFENLEEALDGWLIKSESYQALKTVLAKFGGKVQTIYIDPPFNKKQEDVYFYSVKYNDAVWITMLENRLRLARDILKDTGSIFVRCDYNGNWLVRPLLNEIFGEKNFRSEIILKRTAGLPKREFLNMEVETEYLIYYVKSVEKLLFNQLWVDREPEWMPVMIKYNRGGPTGKPIILDDKAYNPPEGYSWAIGNETAQVLYKERKLKIENGKPYVLIDKKTVGNNWTDIPGYASPSKWGFSTENHEKLLKRAIESTTNKDDLSYGLLLGSGTTTAVAHKIGRKWIGIEMGEHFYTVILPRMKKVLAYDKSGISKEKDVKEKYNRE